jgi:hypothetical protein
MADRETAMMFFDFARRNHASAKDERRSLRSFSPGSEHYHNCLIRIGEYRGRRQAYLLATRHHLETRSARITNLLRRVA